MAGFEAVIFDCDGVLVDSETLALEVELELLGSYGLIYERADFVRRFTGTADGHFRDLLDADHRARLNRPLPEDFLELTHQRRLAACRERLVEVAGARQAALAITEPMAVASSSRAGFLREKLSLVGLLDVFDPHVYSTELVAHGKPAPDVFLYAANQLNVAPARCLVVEDSVNGVLAGCAAGMTVWGFVGGGHCDASSAEPLRAAGAHRIVTDWAGFECLIGAQR